MLTAELFAIDNIWEQSKCLSVDKGIKKMWGIYNEILITHKKKIIIPFATTLLDLEGIQRSE